MINLTKYTVSGTQFQTADLLRAIARAKSTATRKEPGKVFNGPNIVAQVSKSGRLILCCLLLLACFTQVKAQELQAQAVNAIYHKIIFHHPQTYLSGAFNQTIVEKGKVNLISYELTIGEQKFIVLKHFTPSKEISKNEFTQQLILAEQKNMKVVYCTLTLKGDTCTIKQLTFKQDKVPDISFVISD